jgi:nucleoside-diphosphate-sugar epimerase
MSEALARLRPGAPEPALTVHGLTAFAFSQTLDTAKARARLNFAPAISFAQGLEQTLAPGEPE